MTEFNTYARIAELIARNIKGELGDREREQLEHWINLSERNLRIYQNLSNTKNYEDRNEVYLQFNRDRGWQQVQNRINKQEGRIRLTRVLLAAASLALLVGILSILSYPSVKPKEQKRVAINQTANESNSQKVTLVLDGGKNIDLSELKQATFTEKDGTTIENKNDRLNYAQSTNKGIDRSPINTLIVPKGGEYHLTLSDGTRVYLNSMSKLTFPTQFSSKIRELSLEGEAYFEVTKDASRPFVVNVHEAQIKVLGTTFNVKAYLDEANTTTTLVEGSVQMNATDQPDKKIILHPDEQAALNNRSDEITIKKVDASLSVAWTKGRYFFHECTLEEIMRTLSRWYAIAYQFEDQSLGKITFSGGLNKYDKIDPILDILNKTNKIRVEMRGNEISFRKNKSGSDANTP